MEKRKLKMVNATELDLETPKEINLNGVDYSTYIGKLFVEHFPATVGDRLYLNQVLNGVKYGVGYLHTSTVCEVDTTETELIVTTRNTVYFFEIVSS